MKNTLIHRLIILFVVFCSSLSFAEVDLQTLSIEKLIARYGKNIGIRHKKINLPDKLKRSIASKHGLIIEEKSIDLYIMGINESDTVIAYIINERGRTEDISFLIGINALNKVEFVEIIKYREAHGYQIKRKSFLRQFIGVDFFSLKQKNVVKAVTRATFSSHAAISAVKKATAIQEIYNL